MKKLTWTHELVYAVGLITTDGNLSKDARHIAFTSKDLDQVQTFAKILKTRNKILNVKGSYNPEKTYHKIQFGNKELYDFLLDVGLSPNKTKNLSRISIPDKFFVDFLRGHLDGDGSTHSYWDKRWKNSFMLYTYFISASKKHVLWIKKEVERLYELKGRISYQGKSIYRLAYAKKASVALLEKMYYKKEIPYLRRKYSKIKASLDIIHSLADVSKLVNEHA